MIKNKQGFTLIELLVVVLIVGLLAAVALPQYNLAVNKARFTTLKSMAVPYINARNLYYTEHGSYPTNFEDLSIGIPAGMELVTSTSVPSGVQCAQGADTYCCIYAPGGGYSPGVTCGRNDYSLAFVYLFPYGTRGEFCAAKTGNTAMEKVCQKITGKATSSVTGWTLNTPEGRKSGFTHYQKI